MVAWVLSTLRTIHVVLIIMVILTQPVSVRIVKSDGFLLRFNFMFLSFSVDAKKDKSNRKRKKRLRTSAIFKAIKYGLAGSHVEVRSLISDLPKRGADAFFSAAILSIPRYILLAYLDRRSASLSYPLTEEFNQIPLDVTVNISLLRLIFTAVVYFQEIFKIKLKRGQANKESTT